MSEKNSSRKVLNSLDELEKELQLKWNIKHSNSTSVNSHGTPSTRGRRSSIARTCKSNLANLNENTPGESPIVRRSTRVKTPNRIYIDSSDDDKKKKVSARSRKRTSYVDSCSESDTEGDDDLKEDKPEQLFEENVDVEGKRLFSFNTPKKRNGMILAALKTPKTPKNTPHKISSKVTPESKKKKNDLDPKTPRHVRNNVKKELSKLIQESSESDFSVDGSEYSPDEEDDDESTTANECSEIEEDEEDDEEEEQPQSKRNPVTQSLTNSSVMTRQRINKEKIDDYVPESDEYFTAHSFKKIVTSNHTLSSLKNPRLPAGELFNLLSSMKISTEHEKAISSLMDDYKRYFSKWLYILNEGFNILLYGLGSKRNLLQSFHRQVLDKETVLVVNGFFPSLTVKDILDSVCHEILDLTSTPANLHEIVDVIGEEFSLIPDIHMYLIVHNLDGSMLRNNKAQEILSRLAKIPNIHLLASIDHINTPLLWDHAKLSNYNFSWWDVTTMLPYTDETAFENSLLVQNSGELALSSMRSVFQSLTTNARGIYLIIVKNQLKNKGNSNFQGIAFKNLYWACREAFLVSSDLALRAQLTEFLDHKLVRSKRAADGTEYLLIPIDPGLLQQFIDEQK